MVAQITPDYYEAFDVDFAEEQAIRQELAAQAAAEEEDALDAECREWLANTNALMARVDARLAVLAEIEAESARAIAEILRRDAERQAEYAHWLQQQAAESYGDWIARQVAAEATDEEPSATDWDLSDERILSLR